MGAIANIDPRPIWKIQSFRAVAFVMLIIVFLQWLSDQTRQHDCRFASWCDHGRRGVRLGEIRPPGNGGR